MLIIFKSRSIHKMCFHLHSPHKRVRACVVMQENNTHSPLQHQGRLLSPPNLLRSQSHHNPSWCVCAHQHRTRHRRSRPRRRRRSPKVVSSRNPTQLVALRLPGGAGTGLDFVLESPLSSSTSRIGGALDIHHRHRWRRIQRAGATAAPRAA